MTKRLKMAEIQPPGIDIREEIGDNAIMELAVSIKAVGLLQPILVRKTETGYEIIAGHRRFLAHQSFGAETIECKIVSMGADDTILARVHENLFREDITPVDEANIVGYLHYECKWELGKIETKLRKARAWIQTRIDIFHMPEELKEALRKREIKINVANELAKEQEPEKRKYFLENAILHGATGRQVMNWILDFKKETMAGEAHMASRILAESQGFETKPLDCECYLCSTETNVINTIAVNLCKSCWADIYKEKKQARERAGTTQPS